MAIFHLKHPELKEEYKVFAKLNLTAVIKKLYGISLIQLKKLFQKNIYLQAIHI